MSVSAVIIEGPQRARRIDARQSSPRSLDTIDDSERPVLDWTLQALREFGIDDPLYFGGYHIEKIIERFPDLRVRYRGAEETDDLNVFLDLEQKGGEGGLLLISAGTIILPGALDRISKFEAAAGVCRKSSSLGLYFLSADKKAAAFEYAKALRRSNKAGGLQTLFDGLQGVETVELDGLAAPVVDQEAVARAIFRGKAQTLDNLSTVIKGASFLPRERIKLSEWRSRPDELVAKVRDAFRDEIVVVRSSVTGEDGLLESHAGKYKSILDVPTSDPFALRSAIEEVIASYGKASGNAHEDEVLIQPQVRNLRGSGVLLTRDPRSAAPYFVINEDRWSGRSDSVTSGSEARISQRFISWAAADSEALDAETRGLLKLGQELVRLSRLDALDIEYAIDSCGKIHLLQVRPLAAARRRSEVADEDVLDMVSEARTFVAQRMKPVPGLAGTSTILGSMPDWNPAEMIGSSPRPLALSLYQLLIGQEAWAEARARIGYRDVRPEPLILSLGGHPFVDVRASLNSFIPASVDDAAASEWVDACLKRLKANPTLHDKIEFEIAITCLAPDWSHASRRLVDAGIDAGVYAEHLRRLTTGMLTGAVEPIAQQMAALERMGQRREALLAALPGQTHLQARLVGHLLADCKRLGLVPFSILARYAFVSMTFLRGLKSAGAITESQYDAVLHSLPTIAGTIAADLGNGLPVDTLKERYGHLRPNSYEITAPNYAADPARFFRAPSQTANAHANTDPQAILLASADAIQHVLDDLELSVSVSQLAKFIVESIAGREKAKFEFMKNVNAALEMIASLGAHLHLDREQLSFLSISDFQKFETDSVIHADGVQLERRAAYIRKRWSAGTMMRLPDVIFSGEDVASFRLEPWRPNFITRKQLEARAVWLDEVDARPDLSGAIVVIRAADPGYDWIFAHNIAGLVTEYGGVASHMSIRAAEFGIPAAIGCGAVVFDALRSAPRIELDCAGETVRPAC